MNIPGSPLPSRRDFLRTTGLAAVAAGLGGSLARAQGAGGESPWPIIGFSKPFQDLGAEESADFVAKIGWSGIECPVRKAGQIEPDKAAEQLPRFVDAFRKRGLDIPVLVSDITSARQPGAEATLRLASQLGIRKIRLGFIKYAPGNAILPQVAKIGKELSEIGALCGELGIHAGVENHSGAGLFGAPIWDIVEAIRGGQAKNIGIFFDLGHATIEGGLSWPTQAKLAEPYFETIYLKDFVWQKQNGAWKEQWVPLGQGMVNKSFFKTLKASSYRGPVCQHQEYPLDKATMLAAMQQDLQTFKGWLADLG